MPQTDITNEEDIRQLVDEFYAKATRDPLLGPIFDERIQDDWASHLERIYQFWSTVLLNTGTYKGSPFIKHADLPLEQQHFDQWIALFHATVDECFEGPKADEAKSRASLMAHLFQAKMERSSGQPGKSLI